MSNNVVRPTLVVRSILVVLTIVVVLFPLAARPWAQQTPSSPAPGSQIADALKAVTEFEVNGLKVLVKRREGSQTVAAALFIRGGVENISASNAGVEAFMLNVTSEASANFPRDRMRKETARMGTVISDGVNYDYSALSMAATRANFDRSWEIFTDVALHPSFTKEDVTLVQSR